MVSPPYGWGNERKFYLFSTAITIARKANFRGLFKTSNLYPRPWGGDTELLYFKGDEAIVLIGVPAPVLLGRDAASGTEHARKVICGMVAHQLGYLTDGKLRSQQIFYGPGHTDFLD